jgi:hypothetical protein
MPADCGILGPIGPRDRVRGQIEWSCAALTLFTVHVPDEVNLKLELQIESDERELEIELTW